MTASRRLGFSRARAYVCNISKLPKVCHYLGDIFCIQKYVIVPFLPQKYSTNFYFHLSKSERARHWLKSKPLLKLLEQGHEYVSYFGV